MWVATVQVAAAVVVVVVMLARGGDAYPVDESYYLDESDLADEPMPMLVLARAPREAFAFIPGLSRELAVDPRPKRTLPVPYFPPFVPSPPHPPPPPPPFLGPPKSVTAGKGAFRGKQKGATFTTGGSDTDSRTGQTSTNMEAVIGEGGGEIKGVVDSTGKDQGSRANYFGNLRGKGSLKASSHAVAGGGDKGTGSLSSVKGYMSGDGDISGGGGASFLGGTSYDLYG